MLYIAKSMNRLNNPYSDKLVLHDNIKKYIPGLRSIRIWEINQSNQNNTKRYVLSEVISDYINKYIEFCSTPINCLDKDNFSKFNFTIERRNSNISIIPLNIKKFNSYEEYYNKVKEILPFFKIKNGNILNNITPLFLNEVLHIFDFVTDNTTNKIYEYFILYYYNTKKIINGIRFSLNFISTFYCIFFPYKQFRSIYIKLLFKSIFSSKLRNIFKILDYNHNIIKSPGLINDIDTKIMSIDIDNRYINEYIINSQIAIALIRKVYRMLNLNLKKKKSILPILNNPFSSLEVIERYLYYMEESQFSVNNFKKKYRDYFSYIATILKYHITSTNTDISII